MSHIYQPLKLGKFIAILRSLQINYSNKIRIVYMQGLLKASETETVNHQKAELYLAINMNRLVRNNSMKNLSLLSDETYKIHEYVLAF